MQQHLLFPILVPKDLSYRRRLCSSFYRRSFIIRLGSESYFITEQWLWKNPEFLGTVHGAGRDERRGVHC